MSASYGDTDTARAGKRCPYNWAWSTGPEHLRPTSEIGPTKIKEAQITNTRPTTAPHFQVEVVCMASTVNDYGMEAAIYQNGNSYDVSISYVYTGTGTPAGNMKLYAALVDKDCTGYSYSLSGIPHGYNCWMAWLTSEIPTNPRVQVQEMLSIASRFQAPKKANHGQGIPTSVPVDWIKP